MKKILPQSGLLYLFLLSLPCTVWAQTTTQPETENYPDTITLKENGSVLNKLIHRYGNDTVVYAKKGFFVRPSLTVGLGYRVQRSPNGQAPFTSEHSLSANYVINRAAFFIEYRSMWYEAIGRWNLGLIARTDLPNRANFFGVGNETQIDKAQRRRYYRLLTHEIYTGLSLNRLIDSAHFLELRPFYQSVKVQYDKDRIVNNEPLFGQKIIFEREHFAGTEARYRYTKTNNRIAPSKGLDFALSGMYTFNLNNKDRNFTRYASHFSFYLPLMRNVTLASRVGGVALQGRPEFYQLATLGGNENLRGFLRQRFYGEKSFYNNNELRWLKPTKSKVFSKIGLLAFMDNGRVWMPNEVSDTWHVGYGGGLVIVPFNRIVLNGSYGFSKQDQVIHFRIGYLF